MINGAVNQEAQRMLTYDDIKYAVEQPGEVDVAVEAEVDLALGDREVERPGAFPCPP